MTDWHLTIDCADPTRLVEFWCAALDYVPQPPPEGHATWNDWYRSVGVPDDELDLDGDGTDRVCDPTGRRPSIWFQVVPEAKAVKNRLHLDVWVGEGRDDPPRGPERRALVDERVARLLALGASVVRLDDEGDRYFVQLRDPEGNELCIG